MDREKFKAGMESDIHFSYNQSRKMTIDIARSYDAKSSVLCLVEELAELQQALIKNIRGFDNCDNVLEEMADVRISMEILQSPDKNGEYFVDRMDVDKAIDVKLNRNYRRIHNNDVT